MVEFHFLDVGQGNMSVGLFPDGKVLVYDCHITEENQVQTMQYLDRIIPRGKIDLFVSSHREADHMSGIDKLHRRFPIQWIWDSGVPASTGTLQYERYMRLRREVKCDEVEAMQYCNDYPGLRILNGARENLKDPNSQSIVLHVDYQGSSLLLAGDTDSGVWRDYIIPEQRGSVKSLVLLASHHGSKTFFNNGADPAQDYLEHIKMISPAISIFSCGKNNQHDHPHDHALRHYEAFSYGTVETRQKIFRTDQHGNIKVLLQGGGEGRVEWFK